MSIEDATNWPMASAPGIPPPPTIALEASAGARIEHNTTAAYTSNAEHCLLPLFETKVTSRVNAPKGS